MRTLFFLIFIGSFFSSFAQDSLYTRNVIKYLCSEKCYGRGYLKNGLGTAEKFIVKEIKEQNITPLFNGNYTQSFTHPVNTFPKNCKLKVNGKTMICGLDFIPSPTNPTLKGNYTLIKKDSVTFLFQDSKSQIKFIKKNKLTYSVGSKTENLSVFELDKNKFKEEPQQVEINIKNKFISKFKSNNIGCYIDGSSKTDSLIVFTAHYDHLGGIGKNTFFPGANDNASGVSMLLNLIKYYKQNPPKYKTVFVFFAAEEAGLVGSNYFVTSGTIDLKKIKFLLNLDLLGTGDEGIMVVNGAIHEKEFNSLTQINSEKRFLKEIKKRGKAANSDHYWFTEQGVPAFFIYTMGGVSAYHDIFDIEKTLPLTKYKEVFQLLTEFVDQL